MFGNLKSIEHRISKIEKDVKFFHERMDSLDDLSLSNRVMVEGTNQALDCSEAIRLLLDHLGLKISAPSSSFQVERIKK